MKKTTRYMLVILSLLLLCVTMTACNPVPEMRKNHATWNEDDSISYNGKTYRQLPPHDTFSPIIDAGSDTVWVTEPDVPVLLSRMMGEHFYSCQNGDFLTDNSESGIYCDSEIYDDMVQSIEAGAPMIYYCFELTEYNLEKGIYETKRILIDEDLSAALKIAFSKPPIELPPGASLDYNERLLIYRCSKDMMFLTFAFYLLYNNSTEICYLVVENPETQTTDHYLLEKQYLPLLEENIPFLR